MSFLVERTNYSPRTNYQIIDSDHCQAMIPPYYHVSPLIAERSMLSASLEVI